MDREYLQKALSFFNTDKSQWYGWKKYNEDGSVIPNNQRMCYDCLILNDDSATMPTEAEVNAKIEELKQEEVDKETKKQSAKSKLEALGLTTEEIKEAFGI
jgi:hypothetical protein